MATHPVDDALAKWRATVPLTPEQAEALLQEVNVNTHEGEPLFEAMRSLEMRGSNLPIDEETDRQGGDLEGHLMVRTDSLAQASKVSHGVQPEKGKKYQLTIPLGLNDLVTAWALAESRDLASVAVQCLEAGARKLTAEGAIPAAAVERYDQGCRRRIALGELADNARVLSIPL